MNKLPQPCFIGDNHVWHIVVDTQWWKWHCNNLRINICSNDNKLCFLLTNKPSHFLDTWSEWTFRSFDLGFIFLNSRFDSDQFFLLSLRLNFSQQLSKGVSFEVVRVKSNKKLSRKILQSMQILNRWKKMNLKGTKGFNHQHYP